MKPCPEKEKNNSQNAHATQRVTSLRKVLETAGRGDVRPLRKGSGGPAKNIFKPQESNCCRSPGRGSRGSSSNNNSRSNISSNNNRPGVAPVEIRSLQELYDHSWVPRLLHPGASRASYNPNLHEST